MRRRRPSWSYFPSSAFPAYAIDDLLFQDALLDAVERADRQLVEASRRLSGPHRRRAAARHGRALQHRGGDPPRPAASASSRRPICRTTANSTRQRHFASGAGVRGQTHHASPAARVRSASICCSARRARPHSPSTSRSARTSGRRSRHPASPRWPARRCWSICRPATSPSARRETRRLLCASQSARAIAAYAYSAAGSRRIDDRPRLGRPGGDFRDAATARRERAFSLTTRR